MAKTAHNTINDNLAKKLTNIYVNFKAKTTKKTNTTAIASAEITDRNCFITLIS
jgi:hypothetical protein